MMENRTSGTAISLSKLMNIVPKGSIQSIVNWLNPSALEANAKTTPSTSPMMIFQCKARFFIGRCKVSKLTN